MANKQTAVKFLEKQYNENGKLTAIDFEQAKQMEKEQIKKAYLIGFLEEKKDFSAYHYYEDLSEQYYNETFKSE